VTHELNGRRLLTVGRISRSQRARGSSQCMNCTYPYTCPCAWHIDMRVASTGGERTCARAHVQIAWVCMRTRVDPWVCCTYKGSRSAALTNARMRAGPHCYHIAEEELHAGDDQGAAQGLQPTPRKNQRRTSAAAGRHRQLCARAKTFGGEKGQVSPALATPMLRGARSRRRRVWRRGGLGAGGLAPPCLIYGPGEQCP